jgi:hypothetical protein
MHWLVTIADIVASSNRVNRSQMYRVGDQQWCKCGDNRHATRNRPDALIAGRTRGGVTARERARVDIDDRKAVHFAPTFARASRRSADLRKKAMMTAAARLAESQAPVYCEARTTAWRPVSGRV